MFACLHGTGNLAAVAFDFSPLVEQTAPDTVTCDVAGLDRLFGAAQELAAALARRAAETGVRAAIALAANPDAAICAARGFSGVSIVPQGDEAKFLGRLPVALLRPSAELQETLERWGIRRFQDLAALPPLGIAERLGAEGLQLRELARGEAERKLTPLEEPPRFEEELELEYPVELLEPLEFLLARLLNGLTTRLATRGLATNELRLHLHLETRATHERTLRLPAPSLDGKSFLKLLRLDLAGHPPAAPIERIKLGMNPVKPQAAQGDLFVLAAPEPVKLELTLARIQAIVGEGRAGCPELLDTHRPDAFRLQKPGDRHHCPRGAKAAPWDSGVCPPHLVVSVPSLFSACIARPAWPASHWIPASPVTSPLMAYAAGFSSAPAHGALPATGGPPAHGRATNGTSRFPMAPSTASIAR